ncbi:MAG: lysophospholipid acyltransferase family protein [Candidatus Krumholzibacteriota bacterium]|nr:lysophospholipid acyltransferase family protein [Candidatus Krumholzibacteriota bacterium]
MKIRVNRSVASFLGAIFIRLLGVTLRIEWRGTGHLDEARALSGQVVFAFLHGRMLAMTWSHRNRNVHVLASEHYDGDLMGKTIERLGYGHVKGSSTRGGARALMTMTSLLKNGIDIALTVDGPRGPRGIVQQGAIELGRLASKAVIPVSCTAKGRFLTRSWDRFQIPYPFAKVIIEYEKPFSVSRDSDPEERERIRLALEDSLGVLTRRLDREIGYSGIDLWPHEDA